MDFVYQLDGDHDRSLPYEPPSMDITLFQSKQDINKATAGHQQSQYRNAHSTSGHTLPRVTRFVERLSPARALFYGLTISSITFPPFLMLHEVAHISWLATTSDDIDGATTVFTCRTLVRNGATVDCGLAIGIGRMAVVMLLSTWIFLNALVYMCEDRHAARKGGWPTTKLQQSFFACLAFWEMVGALCHTAVAVLVWPGMSFYEDIFWAMMFGYGSFCVGFWVALRIRYKRPDWEGHEVVSDFHRYAAGLGRG